MKDCFVDVEVEGELGVDEVLFLEFEKFFFLFV